MSLQLPGDINLLGMLKAEPPFVSPYIPAEIDSVMDASPAAKIGLKKGDKIVALNGKPIDSYNEFTNQIGILSDMMTDAKTTADSMKLRTVTMVIARESETDTLTTMLTSDLKVGFFVKSIAGIYQPVTKEYGFLESFPGNMSSLPTVPSHSAVSVPSAVCSPRCGTGTCSGR